MSIERPREVGEPVEISMICPVTRHARELTEVHREFHDALVATGRSAELIYVFEGQREVKESTYDRLCEGELPVRILRMARGFGESTALGVGFERARGSVVLTMPDRPQIVATTLHDVLRCLDAGHKAVVTRREPRQDGWINRLQSRVFHALIGGIVKRRFHDVSCGLRGFSADAARKLDLYGAQHRFVPVVALRCGYDVQEIPGRHHEHNRGLRLRGPVVYVRRLLELLNIYFLTRFTRKPLRFFGVVGSVIGFTGFAICLVLALQKLIGSVGLAERPLLLLGVLLIVLGVQVTSIGLLGEIIIFLSSNRERPEVVEHAAAAQARTNLRSS
ncbi:MAG: hypothetical protein GY716_04475 [bacterium]|nr:hypothetical protein [bacterium]